MECKWCNKKTDWDSSVGRRCYIVCYNCVSKKAIEKKVPEFQITLNILKKGFEIEKMLDKNE